MDTPQLLYSPEEGARALGLSRSRIFVLLSRGEIESVQIGRARRIPAEALEQYVARLRNEGAARVGAA
jgi:excisionase family DNA binding protein